MAGYLEEKAGGDGSVLTWETPSRQRLWGLVAAVPGAVAVAHGLYSAKTPNIVEVMAGSVLMLGGFLVATWTVRFVLNLSEGAYQAVKGFLPVLMGEQGPAREAFQCVCVRTELFTDAARHDGEADEYEQYRVFMVWKNPRREAMLIDTVPESFIESLNKKDHHALALESANKVAKPLGLEVLDQSVAAVSAVAVVEMEEESAETVKG